MIKSTDRVPADEAGPASIFSRLPLLLVISAAAGPQKIGFSSTRGLALALFPAPGPANRVMCNTIPDGHLWKGLQILFFQKHRFFLAARCSLRPRVLAGWIMLPTGRASPARQSPAFNLLPVYVLS
jgi:hypothetical protein